VALCFQAKFETLLLQWHSPTLPLIPIAYYLLIDVENTLCFNWVIIIELVSFVANESS